MPTSITDSTIYNLKIRKFFRNLPEESADYGSKSVHYGLLVRIEDDGQALNFYGPDDMRLRWSFDSSHPDFKGFHIEEGKRTEHQDFSGNVVANQEPDWIIIDLLR